MARKDKTERRIDPELDNPFAGLQIDTLPLGEGNVLSAPAGPVKRALGKVVLRRETAHRGGKTVVVIHDFAPAVSNASIQELASKLRRACGCGGTTRQRAIEIQGNQVDKIRVLLEAEGFRVGGVK